MKKNLIFIIVLLLPIVVNGETITVSFDSCIDGDTAHFIYHDQNLKTRFLAINAPEIAHDNKNADFMGEDAKELTCNLLSNASKIELEFDNSSNKEDKYGRTLAWIWIDGKLLQESLIKEGMAKIDYIYDEYLYVPYLCQVEKKAQKERKGIWEKEKGLGYCSKVKDNNYTLDDLKNDKLEDVDINQSEIIILATIIVFLVFMILITIFVIKRS